MPCWHKNMHNIHAGQLYNSDYSVHASVERATADYSL